MIELKIDGRSYVLDDKLRDEIRAKIGSLEGHMDGLQSGHVTVSWEGSQNEQTEIHVQLWGSGHRFEASETDRIALAAVDKTGYKLATQIRREHRKNVVKHRHG